MANVYMDISNDVVFKRVFGRRANKKLLIAILNEIMDEIVVVDLEYLSQEMTGFDRDSKNSRMDLRVKTDKGVEIIIEMQVAPQDYFRDRAVYYACLPILEEIESGSEGYGLTPRHTICILHFSLNERKDPHWRNEFRARYALREQVTMEKLSEAMNLMFIELNRFDKSLKSLENDKERFYFCLKHIAEMTSMPEEFEGNEVMENLFKITAVESLSKEDRIKYLHFMTTERDIRNQQAYAQNQAHAKGLAEGLAKGEQKGRTKALSEFVQRMKANGMSVSDISKFTGLPEDKINSNT